VDLSKGPVFCLLLQGDPRGTLRFEPTGGKWVREGETSAYQLDRGGQEMAFEFELRAVPDRAYFFVDLMTGRGLDDPVVALTVNDETPGEVCLGFAEYGVEAIECSKQLRVGENRLALRLRQAPIGSWVRCRAAAVSVDPSLTALAAHVRPTLRRAAEWAKPLAYLAAAIAAVCLLLLALRPWLEKILRPQSDTYVRLAASAAPTLAASAFAYCLLIGIGPTWLVAALTGSMVILAIQVYLRNRPGQRVGR
jgi:hypothetical protein